MALSFTVRSLVTTKAISTTSVGAQILEKLDNPLIFKGLTVGGGHHCFFLERTTRGPPHVIS